MPDTEQQDADLIDFISNPLNAGFLVRNNQALRDYIKGKESYMRMGAKMTGDFRMLYVNSNRVYDFRHDMGSVVFAGYPYGLALQGRDDLEAAGILAIQNQPYLELKGKGVLVAFIDTGIDYTLPGFRYEDGTTRIRAIWDQNIRDTPPPGFYFGAEYSQEQINAALATDDPLALVPTTDEAGHGTFLASAAANRSDDDYIGAAPDCELIIVKLRPADGFVRYDQHIPPDAENVFSSDDLLVGIEYAYRKSLEFEMPLSICIALGSNMGGHDGFSMIAEYANIMSHTPGVCISAAAGNESRARHHAEGKLTDGGTDDIEIRVGDEGGDIVLEVWTYSSDRVSLSVKSPIGEEISGLAARSDSRYESKLIMEKSRIILEYYFPVEGNGNQLSRLVVVNATPGIWTVKLHGDIIVNGMFHAWLPITGLAYPGIEFLSPSPNYTIMGPATAVGCIAVGAYDASDGRLYADSSWGPSRLPSMAPDLCAPGVDVMGIYPKGIAGTMSGTSCSAAICAGACALLLQWGINEDNDTSLNTYEIKAFLIRGCTREPGVEHPNYQWGYGKLNLLNTFRLMH